MQSLPKKTALATSIEDAYVIDTTDDEKSLTEATETWDDLNELRDSLATAVLEFVLSIEALTSNKDIVSQLGDALPVFNKHLKVFFHDVDGFSKSIQNLRLQHEGKFGKIVSMEELNLFTNLSIQYQTLNAELQSLLSPTIAALVIVLEKVQPTIVTDTIKDTEEVKEVCHVD